MSRVVIHIPKDDPAVAEIERQLIEAAGTSRSHTSIAVFPVDGVLKAHREIGFEVDNPTAVLEYAKRFPQVSAKSE